ncbi:unnamed protein product, partial [Phaeothamnion confervicola]
MTVWSFHFKLISKRTPLKTVASAKRKTVTPVWCKDFHLDGENPRAARPAKKSKSPLQGEAQRSPAPAAADEWSSGSSSESEEDDPKDSTVVASAAGELQKGDETSGDDSGDENGKAKPSLRTLGVTQRAVIDSDGGGDDEHSDADGEGPVYLYDSKVFLDSSKTAFQHGRWIRDKILHDAMSRVERAEFGWPPNACDIDAPATFQNSDYFGSAERVLFSRQSDTEKLLSAMGSLLMVCGASGMATANR